MRIRGCVALVALALMTCERESQAGPEIALREFAGGQVKKGVRTIGMGGDGATTGNYALVYQDAGGALFDERIVRFRDTGGRRRRSCRTAARRPFRTGRRTCRRAASDCTGTPTSTGKLGCESS